MGEAFAKEGLPFEARPAIGARIGLGYDVVSHPISQRSRLLVGTEVDLGLSMLEGSTMVPNPATGEPAEGNNGYMFHQMATSGRVSAAVSVGLTHSLKNGVSLSGALVPSVNLLNPQQVSTGIRLEMGKKVGGMVQGDCQVLGPGRGDMTVRVGAYLKL
jgi:hypothetical protein